MDFVGGTQAGLTSKFWRACLSPALYERLNISTSAPRVRVVRPRDTHSRPPRQSPRARPGRGRADRRARAAARRRERHTCDAQPAHHPTRRGRRPCVPCTLAAPKGTCFARASAPQVAGACSRVCSVLGCERQRKPTSAEVEQRADRAEKRVVGGRWAEDDDPCVVARVGPRWRPGWAQLGRIHELAPARRW